MKKTLIITITLVLLASVVSVYAIPLLRVNLFVHSYHDMIEENLALNNGVPHEDAVLFGYNIVNSWDSDHSMTEFIIMSYGDTYYGCYYSPDDVPLAFQNTDTELISVGRDRWEWTAEGDNHGTTSRIMEKWYYFTASF